jgi:arylformamidase
MRVSLLHSFIDISIPVEDGMIHWPGDPPVGVDVVLDVHRGDPCTLRRLNLGSHTGTHVDAPAHFLPHGATLDQVALSRGVGPAWVIPIEHPQVIDVPEVRACLDTLETTTSVSVARVLFQTRHSRGETPWFRQPFDEAFVHMTPEVAAFLLAKQIQLVGVDYLSVDGYAAVGHPVHHALLSHDVLLLEGLMLAGVTPMRPYELLCLPLPIAGGDGAPARAILRPLD